MNSNWVGSGMARARSVTNMTAPLSTVISSQSAVVIADLCTQLGNALLDLRLGQQHRLDVPGIQLGRFPCHDHSVPCYGADNQRAWRAYGNTGSGRNVSTSARRSTNSRWLRRVD